VAAVALSAAGFAYLQATAEPKYQGRYLSEWMMDCGPDPSRLHSCTVIPGSDHDPRELAIVAARHAVAAIGTNAVPYLLEWLRYQPASWQRTLRRTLPSWLEQKEVVGDWLGNPGFRRANQAVWGFESLGANANGAVPALAAMMRDPSNRHAAHLATRALGNMGAPAIPAFRAAFADTNAPFRADMLGAAHLMDYRFRHAQPTLPLQPALQDRDPVVRSVAEQWVRMQQAQAKAE
jgi:hypothetical protein